MCRKGLCTLGLMAALGGSLRADWKITTVSKSAVGDSIETEYYKGKLKRTDGYDSRTGKARYVGVLDFQNRRLTVWDLDSHQYAVHPIGPQRPPPKESPSATVITIDRATTDTGERRTFFGRTARHLITRERSSRSDGETVIDGWYLDSEASPPDKRGAAFAILESHVAGQPYEPPIIKINETGPEPAGLPVLLKTTSSQQKTTREVTELIEAPLPDTLFDPPPGFERSIPYPGPFRWSWGWFRDWFASLVS